MSKISIVIPIYNTQAYLEKCLNSVVNQTFQDIEIICVNDGSTDNSLEILSEFAKLDSRIIIINLKKNKGVSHARNTAIEISKSPYIYFLDSDDFIEYNCLELLYKRIFDSSADIAFGATNFYIDKILDSNNIERVKKFSKNILDKNLYDLMVTIGGKLYSKNFILKNQIKFIEKFLTSEDFIFNFTSICCDAKITVLPYTTYNYATLRKNSATSNLKNCNTEILAIRYFLNTHYYKNTSLENKIFFTNTCIYNALIWHNLYHGKKNKEYIRKIFNLLTNNIPRDILIQCPNYKVIKSVSKTPLQNIFSLTSWIKLALRILKFK